MEDYLFMKRLLEWLKDEKSLRKVFKVYLLGVAILTVLSGLFGFILAWRDIFRMPVTGIMGGIIFQIFFVIAIYGVVHNMLIKAKEIESGTAMPVSIDIGSTLLRLSGETYALFTGLMAIGGGVFIWFAGSGVRSSNTLFRVINHYFTFTKLYGEGFMQGLVFMLRGIAYAFLALIIAYILADILKLFIKRTS